MPIAPMLWKDSVAVTMTVVVAFKRRQRSEAFYGFGFNSP